MRTLLHRPPANRMRARSGFTVIECLIAIALTTIVGFIAVRLIVQLMRVDNEDAIYCLENLTRTRLAEQWRRDVHQANELQLLAPGDQPPEMLLKIEDRTVRYQAVDDGVLREEQVGDRVASREQWRMSGKVRFEKNERSTVASLLLIPPPVTPSGNPGPMRSSLMRIDASMAKGEEPK